MTDLIRYSIPFRQPFEGAGFKLEKRDGLLIRFNHNGIFAWGEVSPLPGFSVSTLESCIDRYHIVIEQLQRMLTITDNALWTQWLRQSVPEPEMRFGLDTCRTDYHSRLHNLPFHKFLDSNAPDKANVNAVIGLLSPEETLKRGLSLLDSGFRTLKIKIHDPHPYIDVFSTLKNHSSNPQLRFDANGSWSIEKSLDWATALSEVQPEYLEQPFPKGQETNHSVLQSKVNFPLALDESVASENSAISAIVNDLTKVLILKPALIGDYQSLHHILQTAAKHDVQCTLTTLLDAGIARRAVASLVVSYANNQIAHGLSTGSHLSADPLHDIIAEPGQFQLETAAGIGVPILNDTFKWELL